MQVYSKYLLYPGAKILKALVITVMNPSMSIEDARVQKTYFILVFIWSTSNNTPGNMQRQSVTRCNSGHRPCIQHPLQSCYCTCKGTGKSDSDRD